MWLPTGLEYLFYGRLRLNNILSLQNEYLNLFVPACTKMKKALYYYKKTGARRTWKPSFTNFIFEIKM